MGFIKTGLFAFCFFYIQVSAVSGQEIWSDDFEDQDLAVSPEWTGDTGNFSFEDVGGNIMLRLTASEAGSSYLSTPATSLYGTWRWFVRMNFSLSGSNRISIFLQSDAENPSDAQNAIFLQAGESGSEDVFELVHRSNGSETVLESGTFNVDAGGGFQVEASHTEENGWEISINSDYGSNPEPDFSAPTFLLDESSYFAIQPTYTSTRTDLFYFDDISFTKDLTKVTDFSTDQNRYIVLTYSDHLDETSLNLADFTLADETADAVNLLDPYTVQVDFGELPSGTSDFSAAAFSDFYGFDTESFTESITLTADFNPGDIVINEFMYAPESGDAEFVEIINLSDELLDLHDWILQDNTTTEYTISNSELLINPGEYLVLSSDTANVRALYGEENYHQLSSFPALNNSSPDAVRIITDSGMLVDSVAYEQSWGGDRVSLERRSVSAPSVYQENWSSSESPDGATPGQPNSIGPDSDPPQLSSASFFSDVEILLLFNDVLDEESAGNSSNYSISGKTISEVRFGSPDSVFISVTTAFENEQSYTITATGLEDIFGNIAVSLETELTYFEVTEPTKGSLLISEFSYDPPTDATEYIEFYNPGPTAIDLYEVELADNRLSYSRLFSNSRVVAPDSYIVVTPDNVLVDEFPDRSIFLVGSAFPSLNNSGDAIVIRGRNGVLIDSLEYESDWGGNDVALERRSFSVTATVAANWGDAPNGFGTPGLPNEIQSDTEAPFVEILTAFSQDSVFVEFSEAVQTDASSVQVSFDPVRTLDRLEFQNERELLILLDDNLAENQPYAFSLSGVSDLFDNEMVPLDSTVQYVVTSLAKPGELVISEFMYDPGEGYSEFIEIYNQSDNYLNLAEISWNDNGGDPAVISRNDLVLPPDTFAVLTPDETLLDLFPDINLVNMGSRFSALNNGDDIIVLYNSDGMTLDSLWYTSDWGGDGVSLERRDFNVAAEFASNWGDSPSPDGSTVGRENEVERDTGAPTVTSVSAFDHSVKLKISEQLDSTATEENLQVSINNSITVSRTAVSVDGVEVFFNENLSEGTRYEIVVSGLTDIFGNVSDEETNSFIFVNPFRPESKSLLISEFVYLEDAGNVPEFVEIYNNTESYIDLGAVKVGDDRTSELIEPLSESDQPALILAPGEYKAVTYDVGFASQSESIIAIQELPSFNNYGGDAVILRNVDDDSVIDSLLFDDTWPAVRTGESIARVYLEGATADPSKWVAATQTAGAENEVLRTDDSPPELLFSGVISPDTLTLIFDEFVDPQGISITGNGMGLPVIEVSGDRVLADASGLNPVEPNVVTIESVEDVAGNEISALQDLPVAVQLSRVTDKPVINEILFDPISNPGFEQSEFIELYNPTPFSLIIPDEAFSVFSRSSERTTNLEANASRAPKVIEAESFITFYADTALTFSNTRFAQAFGIDESEFNESHFQIDRTTLSMANSNSVVLFKNDEGAVVDSLPYDESWANPNIPDTKGKSLERIRYSSPTDLSGNWTSSAAEIGATPGAANSVAMPENEAEFENKITISVNPFSPDNDGFEDHTSVNYAFEHANYLLTIRIFDQYGRTVRLLTDQRPAGADGSVIWDGNNDDGEKCRFGRYILLITAHDATAGKKKTFKKTVVIATK